MDIQRFQATLQELQSIDFDQYAAQHHSPEELMAKQSDGISLAQTIALLKESISKMNLLDDAYLTLLPTAIQIDSLLNIIHEVRNYMVSGHSIVYFKSYILEIIRFERSITIWDTQETTKPIQFPRPEEIKTVWTSIQHSAHEVATITAQQIALAQELEALRQKITSEIAEISRQKDVALNSQNSIQTNLQEVSAHKASIETILDNLKTLSQKAHDRSEAIDEKIFDLDNQYESIKLEHESIKNKQEESERILREATSRKDEVADMVNLLKDAALEHAFSKRANDLRVSVRWWGIGYTAGAILLAFYIFSILYWTPATTNNDWVNIIANITKISPAVLALIFISRQYTKERSIQEEYAFKAAIALTLTPYADELAKTEDADRRKIFMDTLSKIYQPPMVEKGDMIPPVAEKLAGETINKVVEKLTAQKS